MTDLNDFLSNPPAFMRRNHVRFRGACTLAAGEAGRFILVRTGSRKARTDKLFLGMAYGRTDAGVYEIRQATTTNISPGDEIQGSFEAVWSGYQALAAVQCQLGGDGASIMLTPDLTGCTVVCGQDGNGNARFSHYNLRDPNEPNRTRNAAGMRTHAAIEYAGSPHAVLTKESYYGKTKRGGAPHATVVGWRTGGAWTFWVQYVEDTGSAYKIRDVQQMKPGTRFG